MSRGFVYTVLIVTTVILFGIAPQVMAGGYKPIELDLTVNNEFIYPESETEVRYSGMGNSQFERAAAMSAAGDTCVFDYAPGWQGCVGGGWYESESAINGSIVKRVDDIMLRFNLQADTDWEEQAYSVGGSWHF